MGAYCNFCGRRCFVVRVIPDGPCKGWTGCLATCPGGMAHDLKETGHTHLTAINPVTDPGAAAAIHRSTSTCWADPLSRPERAELARMLARHCKKFWDAADTRRANAMNEAEYTRCHSLTMASAEMSELHLDVTERAEVPAS